MVMSRGETGLPPGASLLKQMGGGGTLMFVNSAYVVHVVSVESCSTINGGDETVSICPCDKSAVCRMCRSCVLQHVHLKSYSLYLMGQGQRKVFVCYSH